MSLAVFVALLVPVSGAYAAAHSLAFGYAPKHRARP